MDKNTAEVVTMIAFLLFLIAGMYIAGGCR